MKKKVIIVVALIVIAIVVFVFVKGNIAKNEVKVVAPIAATEPVK